MAEQDLDDPDVSVLLQQMRGKAVSERVRRHSLLDASSCDRSVDGAIELAGRERLDRIAARKQPAPRQQHPQAPALSATTSETRSPAP